MIDFLMVSTRPGKRGSIEIYPKFVINNRTKDLMIRGGDFYAVWVEERGLWSTDEQDLIDLVDRELDKYADEYRTKFDGDVRVLHMWDSENGMIDSWHKYCQKRMRDSFNMLDETLIFSNTETTRKDYASKRLSYPLEAGPAPAWEKLISTLYSPEERHKLEWAIGSIVSGDSKHIQKFMVLYGGPGTGKSTILNVIQDLFEGYYSVFDAKALGSTSNAFALEAFKNNPLVAIQHDGDLSKIEDNTRLNSIVSHELMTINEKFKSTYANRFKCFLFMGTNKPVKITDAKSGLIRRLIDVTPSGNKLSPKEYRQATKQISFELGAIAQHCLDVYKDDPGRYDDYVPFTMMGASNDFYNFIIDSYHVFKKDDGTTLKAAWAMYGAYCEEAKVPYPYSMRSFKEELKNYFREYDDKFNLEDGSRVRSYYSGFRTERFETAKPAKDEKTETPKYWLEFNATESVLDKEYADCPAQLASSNETPKAKWDNVKTTLKDIDTSKLHYVLGPETHIFIDFDIRDENGNKCFQKNLEAASKWPPTYAELSKGGEGIHLHYIYNGDPSKLSLVYDENIEVKTCLGKSSIRRRLSKCNDLPIATISSGLPLKGEDKLVDFKVIKSEKALRTMIKRNLNKEIHPGTKPSIDFIHKILEDAYNSGMHYDVSDMYNAVLAFAANSTNQSQYCIKLVGQMHFKSEEPAAPVDNDEAPIIFYDIEVFPNLFLVNYKLAGEGKPVIRLINPKPSEIEELLQFRLIGFNNRAYDNHMIYACLMGYTNEQLYNLSTRLVSKDKDISRKAKFGEAFNLSYTDVHDFAAKKQSLKKWEIELDIHHHELGLPWDKPVPEKLWNKVAEYCDNDVIATEAVFNHLAGDFTARQILADLAGMTVNDTTNTLTGKILFDGNRKPQSGFNWRNLAEPIYERDMRPEDVKFLKDAFPEMMAKPHGAAKSILPYFPGYKFEFGKSIYKGKEVGEGGYVDAVWDIFWNVALLDVMSMHPHSAMAEVLFGAEFTKRFKEIVYSRVHIKHKAWEEVNQMLNGMLTPYIQKVINGEMTAKELSTALKIAINSVYGMTAAKFDNLFRDPRNKDNIVAKRGALFMIDLKEFVESRGFKVAHIKTDSIKIPDATPEIIEEVMEFGKRYGYTFEHEATYDRMCLVNNAVYIARYATKEKCEALYGYVPGDNYEHSGQWTATGTQFAVPYVFKTLFSKEPIEFKDLCETKEVKGSAIYLDRNEGMPDVSEYEAVRDLRRSGKPIGNMAKKDANLYLKYKHLSDEELEEAIGTGHNYRFIGRVGNFCPIKPGCGGGELVRDMVDANGFTKYNSVTGAKDYRWLETEMVRELGMEDAIDISYYTKLVDDAVAAISQYGDFEQFVAEESTHVTVKNELPWLMPCGRETCQGCPSFNNDKFHFDCDKGHDISQLLIQSDDDDAFKKR